MKLISFFIPGENSKTLNIGRVVKSIRQSLYVNAIFLLGMNVFPSIVGFLFWILAGRLYNPTDVGTASAVLSVVALLAGIARLGTSQGIIRFLSTAEKPGSLLNQIFTFNILTTALVTSVFLLGIKLWTPSLIFIRQEPFFFVVFCLYVLAIVLGALVRDIFVAYRRSNYAFSYTVAANVSRLALIWIGAGVAGLVGAAATGYLLALVALSYWAVPKVLAGYQFKFAWKWLQLKEVITFSAANYLAELLLQLPQTLLPLLVFNVLGGESNAYAYAALMVSSFITTPGLALATSALAEGSSDLASSNLTLKRAAIPALGLTVAGAILISAVAPFALSVFGPGYSVNGAALLRILCLAAPFMVTVQLFFTYLKFKKKNAELILYSFLIGLISIILTTIYLDRLGIISTGVGLLAGNLVVCLAILMRTIFSVKRTKSIQK